MQRTVNEKYSYNRRRRDKTGDRFAGGYCFGVTMYRDFPKAPAEQKKVTRQILASAAVDARDGDKWAKGLMCGVRDAANERRGKR